MTAPFLRLLQLSAQVSFHYLYVGILNKQTMDENITHGRHKVGLNNKENYYCVCTPHGVLYILPHVHITPKVYVPLVFLPCCVR